MDAVTRGQVRGSRLWLLCLSYQKGWLGWNEAGIRIFECRFTGLKANILLHAQLLRPKVAKERGSCVRKATSARKKEESDSGRQKNWIPYQLGNEVI